MRNMMGQDIQMVWRENIPIFGRITAIADVFMKIDHIKKAWSIEEAFNLLTEEKQTFWSCPCRFI